MTEERIRKKNSITSPETASGLSPISFIAQEYSKWARLFNAQPARVQRFLEVQGRTLADALIQPLPQARFMLPDRVVVDTPVAVLFTAGEQAGEFAVPTEMREQMAGGLMDRLTRVNLNMVLKERLDELEDSPNPAVAASAGLIRFTAANQLIADMLPDGRTVQYAALDGEEIPSIPAENLSELASALTASTDAIAEEEGEAGQLEGHGELQVPYVPAARRFYLPQWVAFDEQDHLLVSSLNEAEGHIHSMQRFLQILHMAAALAPYMIADKNYQRKRYGMLGQLVNQGRALARYETQQIIETIQRRAATNDLNRGLSLSLPYFDDQTLQVKTYDFQVIPAGRIMFIPAFVVRACRNEQVKVAQDTRLDPATRKHLLAELCTLEKAFDQPSVKK